MSEGRAGSESGGPQRDARSRVSAFCEGPLSPGALKLPLSDWEPEGEREREGVGESKGEEEVESERVLVWSK